MFRQQSSEGNGLLVEVCYIPILYRQITTENWPQNNVRQLIQVISNEM